MRAKAAQCKLRKHVRKHKKAASKARWETDQAYAARNDDQVVLVGLGEQLEAASAVVLIATRQRIQANNRAVLVEAA